MAVQEPVDIPVVEAQLLVVEDDPAMLAALSDILKAAGYDVLAASNGKAALELLGRETPALILSDISMPIMDGIELYQAVRRQPMGTSIPFIFLTARGTREDIFAAKALGADDYITKPITSQELLSAVRARLQRTDELRLAQLKSAYKATLSMLANAIEARDRSTRSHVERVSAFALAMSRELGWSDDRVDALELGAILHDIGKIGVREAVLCKTGKLSPDEWQEMREHPELGARMIEQIPYLGDAVPIVMHHHERWNGTGYPRGLSGEAIPVGARLLAVADTFDAMTSDRPYRPAATPEAALEEISSQSGQQFDPAMVEAFKRCWIRGEIARITELFE